jgi:hypothetical protein
MRIPLATVAAVVGLLAAGGLVAAAGPAQAQTLDTQPTAQMNLKPTAKCPQPEIDQMQKVISFVQGQSWSQHPGSVAFLVDPDTDSCRVVLKINKVSSTEQAALEQGGQGRLSIEKTKDYAKPSRLPLLLWIIFGGAGVVFVFVRYGRR